MTEIISVGNESSHMLHSSIGFIIVCSFAAKSYEWLINRVPTGGYS